MRRLPRTPCLLQPVNIPGPENSHFVCQQDENRLLTPRRQPIAQLTGASSACACISGPAPQLSRFLGPFPCLYLLVLLLTYCYESLAASIPHLSDCLFSLCLCRSFQACVSGCILDIGTIHCDINDDLV